MPPISMQFKLLYPLVCIFLVRHKSNAFFSKFVWQIVSNDHVALLQETYDALMWLTVQHQRITWQKQCRF